MTTKHTPGPWSIEGGHDNNPGDYTLGVDSVPANFTILLYGIKAEHEGCGIRGRTLDEQMANTRLIAAAPELLEALSDAEEALSFLQDRMAVKVNPPTLDKIRAAIAKATGEQQ